ncbi:MAG: tetratricopeptide repeat protein, partial [Janthinobacterium lividum]
MSGAESSELRARAEALFYQGASEMEQGRFAAALERFFEAVALQPGFAEAHGNLGWLLERLRQPDAAEQHYRLSLLHDPGLGQIHLNLGVLLAGQMRFDEAELAYRQALALMPDSPSAWSNLGVLQACLRRDEEAEASYRLALALLPTHRLAQFNLSYLLLRQCRLEEGWLRLQQREPELKTRPQVACASWHGEDLTGKAILIGMEGGYGVMIQF